MEQVIPALEGIEVASLATAPTPDLGRQEVNFIDAAEDAGHGVVTIFVEDPNGMNLELFETVPAPKSIN